MRVLIAEVTVATVAVACAVCYRSGYASGNYHGYGEGWFAGESYVSKLYLDQTLKRFKDDIDRNPFKAKRERPHSKRVDL